MGKACARSSDNGLSSLVVDAEGYRTRFVVTEVFEFYVCLKNN